MASNDTLFFIYETAHVPLLKERLEGGDKYTVVALDREVELDLDKAGIAHTSIAAIAKAPIDDREVVEWTRRLALWYKAPEVSFLEHGGILLGEQYEVATLYYLQACVYYLSLMQGALAHFSGVQKIVIPATYLQVPPTADPTARHKENLPVDVMRLLARHMGRECEVLEAPFAQLAKSRAAALCRSVGGAAVRAAFGMLNACMSPVSGRKAIRIFATDPWSRIEPFVKNMDDIELVMSRRAEAREMGLRAIWSARARFHHRLDFADRAVARESAQTIRARWQEAREAPAFSGEFAYQGVSFWPIACAMFDDIVARAEDDIGTIESAKHLFKKYAINTLLLFASTKGHNLVLARVAESMGIPSIENEHALVNDDKTLVHCRLGSRYLASYGPLIDETYKSWGIEPWRLVSIGSPRFDEHARPANAESVSALREKLALKHGSYTVLYGVQQIYLSLEYGNFNSYEAWDIMRDVGAAAERSGAQVLLRPRPGKWRFNFYNRAEILALFGDYRLVQFENLKHLFALCDVVLTGGSTVIAESLLMHKPVIVYLPHMLDRDWRRFEEAGAVLVARTKEEMEKHLEYLKNPEHRAAQVRRADEFLAQGLLNDGRAATRMAGLLGRTAMGPLRGTQVTLEPLSHTRVSERYASWFNDKETTKYTRHGARVMTVKDVEEYVAQVQRSPTDAVFAMIARDGAHIGNISLQKIDYVRGSAEFAIMLGERGYGGKGMATEAGALLLAFGFKSLRLSRITCGTSSGNVAMQRLADRLGFSFVGTRANVEFRPDEYHEVMEYSLSREDFKIPV